MWEAAVAAEDSARELQSDGWLVLATLLCLGMLTVVNACGAALCCLRGNVFQHESEGSMTLVDLAGAERLSTVQGPSSASFFSHEEQQLHQQQQQQVPGCAPV